MSASHLSPAPAPASDPGPDHPSPPQATSLLSPAVVGILLGLAFSILWASAFAAGKIALSDSPPLFLLGARFSIAGVILALIVGLRGHWRVVSWSSLLRVAVLGILNHALYLGLSYSGMTHVSSGLTALLISCTPVLVSGLAVVMLNEPMTRRKRLGLALGLAGVALVVRSRLTGGADPIGVVLILGALASLTLGTLFYKRWPVQIPLTQGIALQLLVAGVVSVAASASLEPWSQVHLSWGLVASTAYLIGPVSIGCYGLWFLLLERGSASAASVWHFLVPPLGLAIGWGVLGEPLQPMDLIGAVPVVVAIALVTLPGRQRSGHKRLPPVCGKAVPDAVKDC